MAGPTESGATPPAAESYVATCRALLVLAAPAERDDARAQTIAESAVRDAIGEAAASMPLKVMAIPDDGVLLGPTGKVRKFLMRRQLLASTGAS